MHFFRSENLQADFLIDVTKSARITASLKPFKPQVISAATYTAYMIGFRDQIGFGDTCFSGVAIENKRLRFGPSVRQTVPEGSGEWYRVTLQPDEAIVESDVFGTCPLYYGNGLVSNRLHLVEIALKADGRYETSQPPIAACLLFDNTYTQQLSTFSTYLKGIRLSRTHGRLSVRESISVVNDDIEETELTPDEYWRYIRLAAEEICNNVEAALNTFQNVRAALTGGRDSRVIYAALQALGRTEEVSFVTLERGRDREIATAILKKYGGRYLTPPNYSYTIANFEDNLDRFCSHHMFSKHMIDDPANKNTLYAPLEDFCLLGGGSGELYRGFFQRNTFSANIMFQDFRPETFLKDIQRLCRSRKDLSDHYERVVSDELVATFLELPGKSLSTKLDSHYLNFRNRFHFGSRMMRLSQVDWNPMTSRHLFMASRGIPANVRSSGRIMFDITRTLHEELAYFEYETPSLDYSKLPYHVPSRRDGTLIAAEGDMSLMDVTTQRPRRRVPAPPHQRTDTIAFAATGIQRLLPAIQGKGIGDVLTPAAFDRVEMLRAKTSIDLYKWYSVLRQMDHCTNG